MILAEDKILTMPPAEIERLLSELRTWTKGQRGRQKQVADALGIDEPLLSNWIAGRKRPGLKYYFALKAFLDQEHPKKGTK